MGEKTSKAARKALYRKYRSKTFDEIVGQEHITKTIQNALSQGSISHAYLFTGPRGVGKTSVARILAHAINKSSYDSEAPSLDIIEIDAASNRRIDDIRELREKVHIAPVSSPYKVYIIDEVHMLTSESFNALLKTLEEPPQHVVFILATTEMHKLPATIVSRTQRHTFRSIPTSELKGHLAVIAAKESISIDDEALELLAEHGDGSFRDSISLLDQLSSIAGKISASDVELLIGIAPKQQLIDLIDATRSGNSPVVLEIVDRLTQSGASPATIAEQLVKLLRKSQLQSADHSDIKLMNDLLEVAGARYQKLKLETILLQTALKSGPTVTASKKPAETKPAPKQDLPKVKPESKPDVKPDANQPQADTEVQQEEAKPKIPSKSSSGNLDQSVIDDKWPEVLGILKKDHNSLYTLMRLASPVVEDNTLVIELAFEFHKKRLDDTKHKNQLSLALEQVMGESPDISTRVNKLLAGKGVLTDNVETVSATPPDDAHASLIANVQDIMGGGEVVDA